MILILILLISFINFEILIKYMYSFIINNKLTAIYDQVDCYPAKI